MEKGGGGTRSFSEDVRSQLGTLAHCFHPSSVQEKRLVCWVLQGQGNFFMVNCNRVCRYHIFVRGGGRRRRQGSAVKAFFFFVAGFFSQQKPLAEEQWCLVTLLNRLFLTSSSGFHPSTTITRTQSLLCRLAHV